MWGARQPSEGVARGRAGRKHLGLQPARYSQEIQAHVWNPHSNPVAEEVCCCHPHFTDGEIKAGRLVQGSRLRRTEPGLRISTREATGEEGFEKKEGRLVKDSPWARPLEAPGTGSVPGWGVRSELVGLGGFREANTGWAGVGGYTEAMPFKNKVI